ncbi:lactam utilization protein LamB [Klebsiella pneumoniae subsp. pneumoniae]|uniref:carbohydrate porin n=1 Tax=Klebsiella pneumoniae TaxID=573 RepID=UPI0007DAF78F|nr:carbohydrate porin [Klebsiella pneumoniae]OAK83922.1 lactam utilization protein LamB [Klebsiella pneumoniae subsp. pneumoniae]
MNTVKKLPLAMAVVAALCPISVMAQEFTQEQIDAIVAKAVDKALADRQAKIDAAANKKVDVITNPETTAASPDMAIPFGLKFSGYARYGAHFQTGDQKYVGVDGSYNGASAIGRLGNESNGGEFQISKAFKSAQGAIWDLNVMFDHWSDEVNLKKAYVGVTNVLESNPNAYLWAGRDFHQRPQQGINDYFWAWQGGLVLSHTNDSGVNKVILRYSDNSDNSVYNKTDDLTTVYASFEGSHKFTQQAQVEYLLAFHDYDNGKDNTDNRKNYGAIVRPMYFWNDVHSTWLEAGYQRVDYDQGGDNHGWKLTLSQNIAIGMGPEFRPMLRFYVTGGQVDNEHTAKVNGTQDQQLDSLNVGGMFEAWF